MHIRPVGRSLLPECLQGLEDYLDLLPDLHPDPLKIPQFSRGGLRKGKLPFELGHLFPEAGIFRDQGFDPPFNLCKPGIQILHLRSPGSYQPLPARLL